MAYYSDSASASGNDSNLIVRFYKKPIQKKIAKDQKNPGLQDKDFEWKTIEKDYVEIKVPGNRLEVYDQPATDREIERFSYQWKQYQTRQDQTPKGIPLDQCSALNHADIRMLETRGFLTVEQLIKMDDTQAQKFHAGYALKKRAEDWYEARVEEIESGRIADLEAQVKELTAKAEDPIAGSVSNNTLESLMTRIESLETPKKKRGRPRSKPIETPPPQAA